MVRVRVRVGLGLGLATRGVVVALLHRAGDHLRGAQRLCRAWFGAARGECVVAAVFAACSSEMDRLIEDLQRAAMKLLQKNRQRK